VNLPEKQVSENRLANPIPPLRTADSAIFSGYSVRCFSALGVYGL